MNTIIFFTPSLGIGKSLDKPGTFNGRTLRLVVSPNPYLQWAREFYWLRFYNMSRGRVLRYESKNDR